MRSTRPAPPPARGRGGQPALGHQPVIRVRSGVHPPRIARRGPREFGRPIPSLGARCRAAAPPARGYRPRVPGGRGSPLPGVGVEPARRSRHEAGSPSSASPQTASTGTPACATAPWRRRGLSSSTPRRGQDGGAKPFSRDRRSAGRPCPRAGPAGRARLGRAAQGFGIEAQRQPAPSRSWLTASRATGPRSWPSPAGAISTSRRIAAPPCAPRRRRRWPRPWNSPEA